MKERREKIFKGKGSEFRQVSVFHKCWNFDAMSTGWSFQRHFRTNPGGHFRTNPGGHFRVISGQIRVVISGSFRDKSFRKAIHISHKS